MRLNTCKLILYMFCFFFPFTIFLFHSITSYSTCAETIKRLIQKNPPPGKSKVLCRERSKERFKERFTVRRPTEEVLYIIIFRSIQSYQRDISSSLTFRRFRRSISSRLLPKLSILSRYRLPLAGSRGSALNTVAEQVKIKSQICFLK